MRNFGLLLLVALHIGIWLYGCSANPPAPVPKPEILAALDTIEAHGLPKWAEWAEYGRAHLGSIGINETLVPAGYIGWTWQFVGEGGAQYAIALGDTWLALSDDDRGLVLLHELWHMSNGDLGHPQALYDLLREYQKRGSSK